MDICVSAIGVYFAHVHGNFQDFKEYTETFFWL